MELRYKRAGAARPYFYRVPIAGSRRNKWVSTGAYTLEEAKKVVQESGADRLVLVALAQVLTNETIGIITQGRASTTAEVLKGWEAWIERKVAPQTMHRYRGSIVQLMQIFDCDWKPLSVLTEKNLDAFVNDEGLKLSPRNLRLKAIQSFYRYASGNAFVLGNIAQLVDVSRRTMTVEQLERRHIEPITPEEYATLIASPVLGEFWHDATVLAYCTGLRVSDCCTLEWASFTTDEIVAFTRKNNRKRLALPFSDPLVHRPELRELIDRLLAGERRDPVFVWPEAAAIYLRPATGSAQMSDQFIQYARKSGVRKSFHGLRVAFCRRLLAAGKTLDQVARDMGHASTATTAGYAGTTSTLAL